MQEPSVFWWPWQPHDDSLLAGLDFYQSGRVESPFSFHLKQTLITGRSSPGEWATIVTCTFRKGIQKATRQPWHPGADPVQKATRQPWYPVVDPVQKPPVNHSIQGRIQYRSHPSTMVSRGGSSTEATRQPWYPGADPDSSDRFNRKRHHQIIFSIQ